jgi:hypothetical protein
VIHDFEMAIVSFLGQASSLRKRTKVSLLNSLDLRKMAIVSFLGQVKLEEENKSEPLGQV